MRRHVMNAVFDTHVHARWKFPVMQLVLKHLVEQGIRYVIIEPNPIVSDKQDGIYTWQQAKEYEDRLNEALRLNGDEGKIKFIVAIKMTNETTPHMIWDAAEHGYFVWKIYAGVTTGSSGINTLQTLLANFEMVAKINTLYRKKFPRPVVVQIHGESPDPDIIIYEKEFMFHDEIWNAFAQFPEARFSVEHISDRRTPNLVRRLHPNVRGALAPQHMLITMNDIFYITKPNGDQHPGLQSRNFFLPCAKTKPDMLAIRDTALHGGPKFHLGSDTAIHTRDTKVSECGSVGAYLGKEIVTLQADLFDAGGKLHEYEDFAVTRPCEYYGIEHDGTKIELVHDGVPHKIPNEYDLPDGSEKVLAFGKDKDVFWRVESIFYPD